MVSDINDLYFSGDINYYIFKGKWYKLLLESPCECSIEPPGSISHGVSLVKWYKLHFEWYKTNG